MSLSPAGFIYGITMQKIKNITMHKDVKTELFFLQFHAHTQSKRRGTLCGLVLLVNFRSLLARSFVGGALKAVVLPLVAFK